MIVVIDNYDSFTYNLVQILGEIGCELCVHRNDRIDLGSIEELSPEAIVISPGPGTPDKAGISESVIAHFGHSTPVLGVCLGHQAIGEVYGAKVVRAPKPRHGKTSRIMHDSAGIFAGLPQGFTATRYHSLILDENTIPQELVVTATAEDGCIMGVRHSQHPVEGVQFHPESILTDVGRQLLTNFVNANRVAQHAPRQRRSAL